jgi:membrane protein required for colicin V production
MNWLDIVILVVIASSTFYCLKIGIIKAVLTLAGMIGGVILAGHFYELLAEQLIFIAQPELAKIVAFGIILVGIAIVAGILAKILGWVVSLVMLGWVNHLGGAVMGFVMGALFVGALLAIWGKFFDVSELIGQSGLASILLDRFPAVLALLPGEFDGVRSFFH